jgi:hypothetical protein
MTGRRILVAALYQAKTGGRGGVAIFNESLHAASHMD